MPIRVRRSGLARCGARPQLVKALLVVEAAPRHFTSELFGRRTVETAHWPNLRLTITHTYDPPVSA